MNLEEIERGELLCDCPCGRTWLFSRGRIEIDGVLVSFVMVPTIHDGRDCWLALGVGERPTEWVFTRTWVVGGDYCAGVVEAGDSPLGLAKAFAALGGTVLPRDRVVGDDARKRLTFAAHDAIVHNHPDVQQLFNPERGRDYSFQMPDCVYAQPSSQRSPRNSENFAECGDRRFVRALLPIAIGDGGELRVGVWVEVDEAPFMALMMVFWDDEDAYVAMALSGSIESSMKLSGRDVRGASVTLAARTADKCLFVRETREPWLASLLTVGVSVRGLPELIGEIQQSVGRVPN